MSMPLFLILTPLLSAQVPSKADHKDEHFVERVDEIAREAVTKEGVPGLSILVSRDGEVLVAKGYGYADAKQGEPARADTSYSLGTLTRTFTATAILQLVDQEKLSLDDELGKLLPGFPTQGHTVRLRHLLTDSSGLPSPSKLVAERRTGGAKAEPASAGKGEPKEGGGKPPKQGDGGSARGESAPGSPAQDEKARDAAKTDRETTETEVEDPKRRAAETAALYEVFRSVPFAFAPGSSRDEDNSGWLVLSMVLAEATGEDYLRVVRTRILEPLELQDTVFCPRGGQRTQGFADDCLTPSDEVELELPSSRTPLYATQSLCSTVADVDRWQQAIHSRALLSEESTRLLLASAAPAAMTERGGREDAKAEPKSERAPGVPAAPASGDGGPYRFRSRTGIVTGFQSHAAYYPDARVSIVLLANCANAPVERIEAAVARLVVGLMPPDIAVGDLPIDEEDIARYAGRYQVATTLVRVFERDGKLWFEFPTQPAFRLMYQGKHVFVHESEKDTRLVFEIEEEGRPAVSFKLLRGGTMSIGKRME